MQVKRRWLSVFWHLLASIKTEDKVIKLAGGTEEDLERINKMVAAPNGIILAVGPTGSGKTTTLYSVLKV